MSDLIKRLVILACIGLLALVCYRWWAVRHPPVPQSAHDPFGLGYPDSPDKPEALAEAERIVIEEWDWIHQNSRGNADTYAGLAEGSLSREHFVFRSESERRKLGECIRAAMLFKLAIIHQQQSGKSNQGIPLADTVMDYLMHDYLDDTLGIRPYNLNSSRDRAILEESGMALEEVNGEWRVVGANP